MRAPEQRLARRLYMREYRKDPAHAEAHRAEGRLWYSFNRETAKLKQREYVARTGYKVKTTPEQRRRYTLQYGHGITPDEYQAMLDAQGGVCALCGKPETAKRKVSLSVDHDHATGRRRGLLCFGCNVSLGYFERGQKSRLDPERVKAYLSE